MRAADGKKYKTQAADLQGIFRIIQSIPSKKAEPASYKNAREDLELQLGRSVISSERASDYLRPIEDGKAQELPFDEDKE